MHPIRYIDASAFNNRATMLVSNRDERDQYPGGSSLSRGATGAASSAKRRGAGNDRPPPEEVDDDDWFASRSGRGGGGSRRDDRGPPSRSNGDGKKGDYRGGKHSRPRLDRDAERDSWPGDFDSPSSYNSAPPRRSHGSSAKRDSEDRRNRDGEESRRRDRDQGDRRGPDHLLSRLDSAPRNNRGGGGGGERGISIRGASSSHIHFSGSSVERFGGAPGAGSPRNGSPAASLATRLGPSSLPSKPPPAQRYSGGYF